MRHFCRCYVVRIALSRRPNAPATDCICVSTHVTASPSWRLNASMPSPNRRGIIRETWCRGLASTIKTLTHLPHCCVWDFLLGSCGIFRALFVFVLHLCTCLTVCVCVSVGWLFILQWLGDITAIYWATGDWAHWEFYGALSDTNVQIRLLVHYWASAQEQGGFVGIRVRESCKSFISRTLLTLSK